MKTAYWRGLNRNINRKGIGTWQFCSNYIVGDSAHGWPKIDKQLIRTIIFKSIEGGVQFFDTAHGYGFGFSEEILGDTLKEIKNEEVFVCSKLPLSKNSLSTKSLDKEFQDQFFTSLKRLNRERLDILLLHSPPDELDYINFDFSFLYKMQEAGYLGTFGVSVVSLNGVQNVIKSKFGTCIQWVFNPLERRPINEIFPLIKNDFNFIARSPLNRGFLNNQNYKKTIADFKNQFRSTLNPSWVEWSNANSKEILKILKENKTLSTFALEFCLSFDEVSVTIPGINKLSYLDEYLKVKYSLKNKELIISQLNEITTSFTY
jgi:aryl-alcohol dehydrogenase-like predicted oxidoreductase